MFKIAVIVVVFVVAASEEMIKPPGWWQFGEYLNQKYRDYGILARSIPCEQFDLTPKQREICENPRYADLMVTLGTSVNLAARVCNTTFQNRRWRCHYTGDEYVFGKIVAKKSKESAVLYSLVSSFAMYTVARDCAVGQLDVLCSCARRPARLSEEEWKEAAPEFYAKIPKNAERSIFDWGGCSEDTAFAYRLTKEFIDDSWEAPVLPDAPTLIEEEAARKQIADNLGKMHNTEQGRGIVNASLRIQCRCHGTSGSCNVQTCWKEMKHWDLVGEDTKKSYDSAVKVRLNNKGSKLINSDATVKKYTEEDLVFLQESPDLCKKNTTCGVEGTSGRQCDTSEVAEDSCSVLCCGRGYRTITKRVKYACNERLIRYPPPIRFVYDTCYKLVMEYYCN